MYEGLQRLSYWFWVCCVFIGMLTQLNNVEYFNDGIRTVSGPEMTWWVLMDLFEARGPYNIIVCLVIWGSDGFPKWLIEEKRWIQEIYICVKIRDELAIWFVGVSCHECRTFVICLNMNSLVSGFTHFEIILPDVDDWVLSLCRSLQMDQYLSVIQFLNIALLTFQLIKTEFYNNKKKFVFLALKAKLVTSTSIINSLKARKWPISKTFLSLPELQIQENKVYG